MSIAIVTDSNSGITQEQGEQLGISVVPMPFYIDGETYFEGINLTSEEFYRRQTGGASISTSMPALGDVIDLWRRLLQDHEAVLYIPMSSGLSSSCLTAKAMAEESFPGKVFVVNNQRISVTQRQSVLDAMELASRGMDAAQIQEYLERTRLESSIYITVDTLTYLKKGGRITPAAAAIGTLLRIKPVLQIQGEKLDSYAKCRTTKQAQAIMLAAIDKDLRERFHLGDHPEDAVIAGAYTCSPEEADKWINEVRCAYPHHEVHFDPLSLSVACHIGPGSTAVTISRRLPDQI